MRLLRFGSSVSEPMRSCQNYTVLFSSHGYRCVFTGMYDVDHLAKFIFLLTNFDIYLQDENVNGSTIRLDLVLLLFLSDMDTGL